MVENREGTWKYDIRLKSQHGFVRHTHIHGNSVNQLITELEVLGNGVAINDFLHKYPNLYEEQLQRLDKVMPSILDAKEIYNYAIKRKKLSNLEEFEDTLGALNDPFIIIEFTKNVEGVNKFKMEKFVIQSENTTAMVEWYEIFEDVDEEAIKNFLFEKKNPWDIYYFFYIKTLRKERIIQSDIFKAESILMDAKKMDLIRHWAEHIKGANIERLEKFTIDSKDFLAMFRFAQEVKGANKARIRHAFVRERNQEWITKWRKHFGNN